MTNKQKLSALRKIENDYLMYFSEAEEYEIFIKFTDNQLPSMYSHNCIVLKETLSAPDAHKAIKDLLSEAQNNEAKHLFIIVPPNLSLAFNAYEADQFDITSLLYMTVDIGQYRGASRNTTCKIYEATSSSLHLDAVWCGIVASLTQNEEHAKYGFAYQRAHRKIPVFECQTQTAGQYIAYQNDIPVGKCEMSYHEDILRIESFDVISGYQRQGIGTEMLNKIIRDGQKRGCREVFLVADAADTAKEMYKKLGFQIIGVEYLLLWLKG